MHDTVSKLSGLSPWLKLFTLNYLGLLSVGAWGERQFTLIMKFECIGFTSFLHKLFLFNFEYVYKCINLYIEKLIFNTCTVCSCRHNDFWQHWEGLELLLWFWNQTQHFSSLQGLSPLMSSCSLPNCLCATYLTWEFTRQFHPLFCTMVTRTS